MVFSPCYEQIGFNLFHCCIEDIEDVDSEDDGQVESAFAGYFDDTVSRLAVGFCVDGPPQTVTTLTPIGNDNRERRGRGDHLLQSGLAEQLRLLEGFLVILDHFHQRNTEDGVLEAVYGGHNGVTRVPLLHLSEEIDNVCVTTLIPKRVCCTDNDDGYQRGPVHHVHGLEGSLAEEMRLLDGLLAILDHFRPQNSEDGVSEAINVGHHDGTRVPVLHFIDDKVDIFCVDGPPQIVATVSR